VKILSTNKKCKEKQRLEKEIIEKKTEQEKRFG
jgi:hypothetical protein